MQHFLAIIFTRSQDVPKNIIYKENDVRFYCILKICLTRNTRFTYKIKKARISLFQNIY